MVASAFARRCQAGNSNKDDDLHEEDWHEEDQHEEERHEEERHEEYGHKEDGREEDGREEDGRDDDRRKEDWRKGGPDIVARKRTRKESAKDMFPLHPSPPPLNRRRG